jgi:DNA-binding MarR family transcriptional regulator
MPHGDLTEEEFHAALERVYERLMQIGWIEKTASRQDKTAIVISPLGSNRLNILRDILYSEISPRLDSEEYCALIGLLSRVPPEGDTP